MHGRARVAKHAGGCGLLLRRGRRRPQWALGRVCTTQPGVSCGVCHKCRASAEARRRSGCVGGIARGIEVLRVHGVGRRGGARGAVSLCAPHSPARAVAHSFVRSGSHGAAGAGCEGAGGSRTGCAGGGLHGCAASCVRDRGAEPRGGETRTAVLVLSERGATRRYLRDEVQIATVIFGVIASFCVKTQGISFPLCRFIVRNQSCAHKQGGRAVSLEN